MKVGLPLFCDGLLVFSAGFFVQDLQVDVEAFRFQALHGTVVDWQPVAILVRFEWASKDCVRVAVVCHHEVLIVAAASDREPSCVIGENLTNVAHLDVNFQRFLVGERRLWVNIWESDYRCIQQRRFSWLG